MDRVFKYLGYASLSFLVALLSTLGKEDFIDNLSDSIIQVLIALLALYSTISSLLVSRLLSFRQEINQSADLSPVVESMKRNVRMESILIISTLLIIIVTNVFLNNNWLSENVVRLVRNAMVVFTLLYFVIVVYDSSMGLYDLLQSNELNNKK